MAAICTTPTCGQAGKPKWDNNTPTERAVTCGECGQPCRRDPSSTAPAPWEPQP